MQWIVANINMVTVILALAFILPLISGFSGYFTRERMRYSLSSLLESFELAAGIIASVYMTKRIFFEHDGSFFSKLYDLLPPGVKDRLLGQDILTYVVAVPIILIVLLSLARLVTAPLYKYIIVPVSDRIYAAIHSLGPLARRLAGGLWQLPRAVAVTLVFALILNFSMYYIYSPVLSAWLNESAPYRMIYRNVLYPVLNSNIAKKIPVIVGDTFGRTAAAAIPQERAAELRNSIEEFTGGNVRVIEYFNGVTLDEAVKSSEEIDRTAAGIVGDETDDREKAYLIYKWVAENIDYDYEKAANIAAEPSEYSSGSIPAFETREGICFDYSALYVSMCRAVDLKVRLVTGLGYSGTAWGDHAWNQVLDGGRERWINVDATFGSTGADYFDKRDFSVDHRETEVQGEW